jgi:uncharacterized Ntn-hydrolase superfamily protein
MMYRLQNEETAMPTRTPTVSTFSIVARDMETGDLGIAVQSKFLAVGAVVPWARANVGAVATQAHANVAYGPDALALLEAGTSAQEVLDQLVSADRGRDARQAGIVDAQGRAASFTGPECSDWAGGHVGEGFCCQGNILTGPEVVTAMAEGYSNATGSFAHRLLTSLEAGQAAGGDSRGQQSAAILIVREGGGYSGGNDRWIDLRIDDHPTPIEELRRLVMLHRVYFDLDDADLEPLDNGMLSVVASHLTAIGYLDNADAERAEIDAALARWAGRENLEERLRDDNQIDSVMLQMLVAAAR